jgi:hypothetical protein
MKVKVSKDRTTQAELSVLPLKDFKLSDVSTDGEIRDSMGQQVTSLHAEMPAYSAKATTHSSGLVTSCDWPGAAPAQFVVSSYARGLLAPGELMLEDDPIVASEAALRQAQLAGDVVALDQLLDDALIFTTIEGTIVRKADDLELHRTGRMRIHKLEPRDREIMPLGDSAVVLVGMDAEATIDGILVRSYLRYTRVWCKRPQGWRVVAGHMSAVPG